VKEDDEEHSRGGRDRKALESVRGFQMDHSRKGQNLFKGYSEDSYEDID
jgi:hypothetical protein